VTVSSLPVVDVDAHEMIPLQMWPETFGDAALNFTQVCTDFSLVADLDENTVDRPDIFGDQMEIDETSVWEVRGPDAPGAIDLSRRTQVLDVMGVDRQLIFPTFALAGMILRYDPKADRIFGLDSVKVDRQTLGTEVVTAHNDWALRTGKAFDADRVRVVGVLMPDSLEVLMSEAERLVSGGIKAVMLPAGIPPADVSPADRALDPFWRLMAEANVPVLLHIGTEFPLLASKAWGRNVPEFAPSFNASIEFPIEPYWGATLNFTHENFLTTMVLGGVFERHPMLRFGCIEVGAQWIGPFAERLDLWAAQFGRRFVDSLSMRPSEYLNRNVRVGPFVFEDVKSYFDRYPHIADVYCFSTDYPHKEGGRHSKRTFAEKLADVDPVYHDKFFSSNGEWIVPQVAASPS
jgi:predicted TIM-barrel fold metal-dependent hydrolase